MAFAQHNRKRKGCKTVPCLSEKSEWSVWMNGGHPEWFSSKQARALAEVFKGSLPAWVVESEPWREVNHERFRFYRKELLGLTQAQCGHFLGVNQSVVSQWERGAAPLPRSAFEALRWLSLSITQRLSHSKWDGWFVNRETGRLVSPDYGRLSVEPSEVSALPMMHQQIAVLKGAMERRDEEINELKAEIQMLRAADRVGRIAGELGAMQRQIGDMLDGIKTAQIIPFEPATQAKQLASA